MKDGYIEASVLPGIILSEAVELLLKYKDSAILAYIKFNGTTLYSDTVTMDGAYKEITGKTKAEYDKEREDTKIRREKEEQEYERKLPELILFWKRKGREILENKYWANWDEIVPIRLKDLYHGLELGNCLDIIKILNEKGTLAEAKEIIEGQRHSGMSFSLVSYMVKEFSSRGNEFFDYIQEDNNI